MTCQYCGADTPNDETYCDDCREPMREAAVLLFAGLAELFLAVREQEEAERKTAA